MASGPKSPSRWAPVENEAKGGCGILLLLIYCRYMRKVHILRHTRRPRGRYKCGVTAVHDCRTASEHCGVCPSDMSEPCGQRQNVSATSLLALDLHPNVAGIGMLHRTIAAMCAVKDRHALKPRKCCNSYIRYLSLFSRAWLCYIRLCLFYISQYLFRLHNTLFWYTFTLCEPQSSYLKD